MRKYPRYRLIINPYERTLKLYKELDRVFVELVAEAKLGEDVELEKIAEIIHIVNEELAK